MSSTEKATRVHADLVRPGGLRLDRVGVNVLEELEAAVAVWRLEHCDVGVVAVEADGGVGPLTTDGVSAEDGQPEVGEEFDRRFEVADGDADVLEFDGHTLHATEPGRRVQVRGLPVLRAGARAAAGAGSAQRLRHALRALRGPRPPQNNNSDQHAQNNPSGAASTTSQVRQSASRTAVERAG
jgi:hypothetical protein